MNLLIVESPVAARHIAEVLGDGWRVEATHGHLKDLPVNSLGVDVTHDFALQYEIIPWQFGTLARLKASAHNANCVYLGTAPDREGETIAAHVAALLKDTIQGKPMHRVTFSAITAASLREAISHPRQIDARLVEAQAARRTVDHLVGYLISALTSNVLKTPHSIGRVQMAMLWLLVAREGEIETGQRQPSTRYTDRSLRQALDEQHISNAGEFDHILKLLIDKGYLIRLDDRLRLTAHARALCAFLSQHFPALFAADYTAQLEQRLDQIAAGETTRLAVLRDFWQTFERNYSPLAAVFLPKSPHEEQLVATGVCSKCGGRLVVRHTRHGGQFASCENFPKCNGRAAPLVLHTARAGR